MIIFSFFPGERKNYCIQSAVRQLWHNCSVPSVWSPRGSKGWRSGLPYQECDPLLHLLPPHWMAGTYYSNSKMQKSNFTFEEYSLLILNFANVLYMCPCVIDYGTVKLC